MNDLGMSIKHAKRRGEWAELRFMSRAAERGLCVSTPWGETAHYDFVVEYEPAHFLRVQVKSTGCQKNGGYACAVRGAQGVYAAGAFDFLAAYLIPEDLWYIIPAEKIRGYGSIMIYPTHPSSKYAENREAWASLIGARPETTVKYII